MFTLKHVLCIDGNDKESSAKHLDDGDELGDNGSNCDEDYSDDGDEGEDGYKPGGYHRVRIGDKFNGGRYTIIEKLGWGHFSTVWMAYDKKAVSTGRPEFVALKVQKSAPHYREAALDEIELLNSVTTTLQTPAVVSEYGSSFDPCVVLLYDSFDHVGPNGKHMCMTFEMLGENLLKVIKKYDYQGIPVRIVKNMVRQICIGLDYLHRHCSIIHTDLKPENVLIAAPPPTPDMEVVRSLVATVNPTPSKKNRPAQKSSATSSDAAAKGEGMTPEQKKNLKKKMKKKRQQERKKGKEKGRRKPSAKCSREDDTTALKEMIMMELGSIPAEISSEENAELVEKVAKQYAAAGLALRSPSDDDKGVSPAEVNTGADTPSMLNEVLSGKRSADSDAVPPAWQRPTLFSYLNFCAHPVSESTADAKGLSDLLSAEIINRDQFVGPEASKAGRLCMVWVHSFIYKPS